jgi:hypothetical protein
MNHLSLTSVASQGGEMTLSLPPQPLLHPLVSLHGVGFLAVVFVDFLAAFFIEVVLSSTTVQFSLLPSERALLIAAALVGKEVLPSLFCNLVGFRPEMETVPS